jgi:beta-lactamase superfamily II metal-dependent hydrolase
MQKNHKSFIIKLPMMLFVSLWSSCGPVMTLLEVSPSQAPADQQNEIQIRGSGFSENIRLSLQAAGLKIPLGIIDVLSDTQLTATVPSTAPAETYDVIADQNSQTSILPQAFTLLSGTLRIYFLDVEQGDATLIVTPERDAILIDGGPAFLDRKLIDAIQTYTDTPISLVVLSHHDADHLGGMVEYLSGEDGLAGTGDDLMPQQSLAPHDDGSCTSQTCFKFRQLLGYPLQRAYAGTSINMESLNIEVVASDGDLGNGPLANELQENEKSVGILLKYAGREILVAGDLTGGGADTIDFETPLSEQTGTIDVLRVSHHGSISSTPLSALETWSPQIAILSAGTHNSYCHPHPEVMDRLLLESESIWLTGDGPDPESCGHALPIDDKVHRKQGDILVEIDADGAIRIQSASQD